MVDRNKDGRDDVTGKPVKKKAPVSSYLPQVTAPAGGSYRPDWSGAERATAAQQIQTGGRMQFPEGMAGPGKLAQPRMPFPFPGNRASAPPVEKEKTLADYLQEAISMIGSQGGGGGGVNYDPQRNTLRQNASEADSRLEAMYRQLRGSIDADAPVLQKAYGDARTATAQNTEQALAQTQAASDSATSRNDQVLANLGIEQAAGNQIINGTDLATQTAGAIANQATKGQAAADRLVSNEATAIQHNTNIGNAAGLEGNLQRAGNQARLQALLAEIDMQEQQQNASLSASSGANSFSQQLQLAQSLLGFDRDKQDREDQLQMSAAEQANARYQAELKAQGSAMPDLGAYLQALGINPADIAKNPQKYGSLLSSLTKFGVTK